MPPIRTLNSDGSTTDGYGVTRDGRGNITDLGPGNKVTPQGNIEHADHSVDTAKGDPLVRFCQEDDADICSQPDGSYSSPDGSLDSDGTFTDANGFKYGPDGSVTDPNGVKANQDGTQTNPDGSVQGRLE